MLWARRWRRAALAVVLRPAEGASPSGPLDLELLVVRRAVHPGDPWSGNVALPGGKALPGDAALDPLAEAATIARREADEEVGLALGEPVTTLSDQMAFDPRTGRPMVVTPVVFAVPAGTPVQPDATEVVAATWLSLTALADPANRAHRWRRLGRLGVPTRWPERTVGDWVVWGLTLRVVDELLADWPHHRESATEGHRA